MIGMFACQLCEVQYNMLIINLFFFSNGICNNPKGDLPADSLVDYILS